MLLFFFNAFSRCVNFTHTIIIQRFGHIVNRHFLMYMNLIYGRFLSKKTKTTPHKVRLTYEAVRRDLISDSLSIVFSDFFAEFYNGLYAFP